MTFLNGIDPASFSLAVADLRKASEKCPGIPDVSFDVKCVESYTLKKKTLKIMSRESDREQKKWCSS